MNRLILTLVVCLGGAAFTPARADDRDAYAEWLNAYRAWRLAPRWETYYFPEAYPTYGGFVPGFAFNERFEDPARGYNYSRYGRRPLPGFIPAYPVYPAYPPPVAWGGVYYPYPY